MLLHFRQQMRRIWRRDSLRREMPADVEVSRVLLFLDDLMVSAGFLQSVLLLAAILVQDAIAR